MYPVLILRCEFVCLIILAGLITSSRAYHMGRDSRIFYRLCSFAVAHVAFDIVTVWTVNHLDTVPGWINYAVHLIFYYTAIFFSLEILHYVAKLCYPDKAEKVYKIGLVLPALYLCALPWLPMRFVAVGGTNSSTGPAAYVGYGIAFVYFITSVILILLNTKTLSKAVKRTLLPFLLILIFAELLQCFFRQLLFTGAAVTIVSVALFFTLENPVKIFERKVLVDALTGVRSRHSYDSDIAAYDDEFVKHPDDSYTFAFCDINNLRAVNARFGHAEGDNYINFICGELKKGLKSADAIYRMGGDEFLVAYHNVPEETVLQEMAEVHRNSELDSVGFEYEPSVAIGYAISSAEYNSLRDVLRTADYMMYRNKAEMKERKALIRGIRGTRLNLTGLTDRLFDAMSNSNDRTYPFITNMETGVTRISDYWRDYFNMEDVFYSDFLTKWSEYIHPDDRQAYLDDVQDTIGGRQQFHACEYRALNPAGEYVKCSCHGSLYHGKDGDPDIFAGYMLNHGVVEILDPITGLYNFSYFSQQAMEHKKKHEAFSVLKLRIRNFGRINMLYGYEAGNELKRLIAKSLCTITDKVGTVYCQDGINFSIEIAGNDREKILNLYKRITASFSTGIFSGDHLMPLELAAGAAVIDKFDDSATGIGTERSSLIAALEESDTFKHGELVFTDELGGGENSNVGLLAEIHKDAVGDKKYFYLCYQPMVSSLGFKTRAAEALLRWKHPDYGQIPPDMFIYFLENDPGYYELGFHILRQAIEAAVEFRKVIPDFRMSVNITALQLQRDDFLEKTLAVLQELNYPADGLMLELTERCKALSENFLRERIASIRAQGIKVALDDVCTGYSSITLMLNIPVDEMKLDKDFTRNLPFSGKHRIIADALAMGARDIDIDLCFEGIENMDQLTYVMSKGNFLCQGYYFSKPLLKDEFAEYINK